MSKGITGLTDSELISVANQVHATITPVPATYGTDAAGVLTLGLQINTFLDDVTAQTAAIAASKAATVTKEAGSLYDPVANARRVGVGLGRDSFGDDNRLGPYRTDRRKPPDQAAFSFGSAGRQLTAAELSGGCWNLICA